MEACLNDQKIESIEMINENQLTIKAYTVYPQTVKDNLTENKTKNQIMCNFNHNLKINNNSETELKVNYDYIKIELKLTTPKQNGSTIHMVGK